MALDDKMHPMQSFYEKDPDAFQKIFEEYHHELLLFCRHRLEKEDAEDIIAETFTSLWQNIAKMEGKAHIRNFLYRVASNKSISLIRRNKVHKKKVIDPDLPHWRDVNTVFRLDKDILDEIYKEMEMLPAQCREVFKLQYVEQKSVAEIALLMKIKTKTVYAHCAHAIKRIRESAKVNEMIF